MFEPLSYPTDMEVENLFSTLPDDTAKQLHDFPTDEKQNQKQNLFKRFEKLATTKTKNKTAEKLLNRIHKHKNSLLNFVDYPDAEYHNNRAERTIRPSVIARKISFGNRTVEGARNHSILVSTLHTIRLNNKDPVKFIHDAISKPNETLQSFNEMILG
jgi:transposase